MPNSKKPKSLMIGDGNYVSEDEEQKLNRKVEKFRLRRLDSMLKRERGHCQSKKLSLIFTLVISIILLTLMRGSSSFESIIKIEWCSTTDWILIAVFLVICVVDGILAIILIRHNQGLKLDFKRGLVESDLTLPRTV